MELLKALESIRSPLLDKLMLGISALGLETAFLLLAIVLFWCVDKWRGYYLLSVGFVGTLVSQCLKILCRVPRPWLRDPSFHAVEAAKPSANGYSFPSGHSQNVSGSFCAICRTTKRAWVRWTSWLLMLLVAFSRLYLGVHDLADVGVGLSIGLLSALCLEPLLRRAERSSRFMYGFLGVLGALALLYLGFLRFWPFPEEVHELEPAVGLTHHQDALKNAWSLLGAVAGLSVSYAADRRTNFSVKAPLPGQLCKVVLGLLLILGIRAGLKWAFAQISDDVFWACPRYFCMVVAAGALWPRSFPLWARLGKSA